MSKRSSKKRSYLGALSASAPIFGVKALIGDLPKGAVEKAVESKIRNPGGKTSKYLSQGLKGRGLGRAMGGATGILTAPIFLEGIRLAKSKDPKKRKKGIALLAGTGGIYAAQKGLLEGYRSARVEGKSRLKSIRHGSKLGLFRTTYKVPAAVLLGLTVAEGQSKKDKSSKYLIPILGGSAVGAVQRGSEHAFLKSPKTPITAPAKHKILSKITRALPAAAGGAAGGALGGLVLAGAVDQAMKLMEKRSYITPHQAGVEARIGTTLKKEAGAVMTAAEAAVPLLHHFGVKGAMGYDKAGRLLSRIPGGKTLGKAADEARKRNLAIGIREGLAGRRSIGWRGKVLGNLGPMPETQVNRAYGQLIGRGLRYLPPEMRPQALKKLQRFVKANPKALHLPGKGKTPVLAQLDDAVEMALGNKAMYSVGQKSSMFSTKGRTNLYKKMMFGGRGVFDDVGESGVRHKIRGLPRAGKLDAPDSRIKKLGPAAITGALAGGSAMAGLPLFATMHLGIGAAKGSLAQVPAIQRAGLRQIAQGLKYSYLPMLKPSKSEQAGRAFMDYAVSPASRDPARLAQGFVSGIRAKGAQAAKRRRALKAARRNKVISDRTAYGVPASLAGAGGLGILLKKRRKKKKRKS